MIFEKINETMNSKKIINPLKSLLRREGTIYNQSARCGRKLDENDYC